MSEEQNPYSYKDLAGLCKSNPMVFHMALAIVWAVGTEQIANDGVKFDSGNLLAGNLQKETEDIAARLADTPLPIILAVIQRDMLPVEDKDMLPPLPKKDEEFVCPVCGSEIYPEDDHTWECPDCGASGTNVYGEVFIRHDNVCNGDGDPV